MRPHVKNYLKSTGHTIADVIYCELCGNPAVDIHHIIYKSQGGTDDVENLIALCRHCHDNAHDSLMDKKLLIAIAKDRCEEEA